ncbi:MurR/RpiR family transcriptional regulator [Martelella alba]|uniref:MurR/RpiR family transcriptional regulator n=1 Tax=Martelella alba TaxID=2590451 RepID=A0ABY2SQF1_9HYPH|nr:MurR/RpiR family transcriptional regulator [Martelella alba]TKI06954.1 MurR/RpiR family transcriptional regulator [Martelella alba]
MADSELEKTTPLPDLPNGGSASAQNERQAIYAELDRRAQGQRLTPAQRRIAQCLIENSNEIGFLSSLELAKLANVSQPSVTRFATSLGFDGYLEMRRHLRSGLSVGEPRAEILTNRYQAAAQAEMHNLEELSNMLADDSLIDRFGAALASSRPLAVLGLRASCGLAAQFAYFAAKVHPDIRLLTGGGSINEDRLEQVKAAGGTCVLAFMMPLFPRETVRALEFAREIGLTVALVADASLADYSRWSDMLLQVPINTSLVFDSYSAPTMMVSVLLDAMCNHMKNEAQSRLDHLDHSSRKRKVFTR